MRLVRRDLGCCHVGRAPLPREAPCADSLHLLRPQVRQVSPTEDLPHWNARPRRTSPHQDTIISTLASMDIQTLSEHFAISGVLSFTKTEHGLTQAIITTPACTAELYLQGAHLAGWQPTGKSPVLFLSERSAFESGKAIRGGVPIIFPWFGARTATPDSPRTDGPSHGFARIALWKLAFAAVAGDDLHLTLTLGPNEASRALGFDNFQLAYKLILGAELRMSLIVANPGTAPLRHCRRRSTPI